MDISIDIFLQICVGRSLGVGSQTYNNLNLKKFKFSNFSIFHALQKVLFDSLYHHCPWQVNGWNWHFHWYFIPIHVWQILIPTHLPGMWYFGQACRSADLKIWIWKFEFFLILKHFKFSSLPPSSTPTQLYKKISIDISIDISLVEYL